MAVICDGVHTSYIYIEGALHIYTNMNEDISSMHTMTKMSV